MVNPIILAFDQQLLVGFHVLFNNEYRLHGFLFNDMHYLQGFLLHRFSSWLVFLRCHVYCSFLPRQLAWTKCQLPLRELRGFIELRKFERVTVLGGQYRLLRWRGMAPHDTM